MIPVITLDNPLPELPTKLRHAIRIAQQTHDGVFRKYGNRPYIVHPQEVYNRVAAWERPIPHEQRLLMGCAAWLHDTVEDWDDENRTTKTTRDEIIADIRENCGEDVLTLVLELTNPSKGSTLPRAVRKLMDRDHLKTVSHEARILKLFDRMCNLKDFETCPDREFMKMYAHESILLLEALKPGLPDEERLIREFAGCVRQLEGVADGDRLQQQPPHPSR